MLLKYVRLLASVGLAALFSLGLPSPALAQTAPNLLSEAPYGVVSSTFTNSNTATQTIVNGNVCFTTGPVTPPVTTTGSTTTPCPVATGTDQGSSTAFVNSQACTSLGAGAVALDGVIVGGNPPGTFPPGCYSSGGAMNITLSTTVTLSGAGVYIFRPGGALTTGANSLVTLTNGACGSDVFWAPIAATTLGANAAASLVTPTFVGTIFDAAGITLGHFAHLGGRALAFGGTVTSDANTITIPSCPAFVPPAAPTVAKAFSPSSNGPGGISTLTITLTNNNATAATLSAALVDSLPAGVVIAATPSASTTCGGGVVTATAGGSSITLATGATIPGGAPGSCRVIANVTSATAGTYTNTIPVGGLQTSLGNNAAAASAVLTIDAATAPVPTLPEWAMIVLAALLCLGGFIAVRRRRMTD